MPDRRTDRPVSFTQNKNKRRKKKKIYQRPTFEVMNVHVESHFMTGSDGLHFGGSSDSMEEDEIWAE